MPLRSLSALAKAIDAVKKEAGDSAEYKPLLDALAGVREELSSGDAAADAKEGAAEKDPFQAAEQKHKEHTAARIAADKAAADKPTPGDAPDAAQDGAGK